MRSLTSAIYPVLVAAASLLFLSSAHPSGPRRGIVELGQGVYRFTEERHSSLFMVTGEGIVVTDLTLGRDLQLAQHLQGVLQSRCRDLVGIRLPGAFLDGVRGLQVRAHPFVGHNRSLHVLICHGCCRHDDPHMYGLGLRPLLQSLAQLRSCQGLIRDYQDVTHGGPLPFTAAARGCSTGHFTTTVDLPPPVVKGPRNWPPHRWTPRGRGPI